MDNTTTNVSNTDDAAKNIKRLHTLVESNELQNNAKRVAEIRKRIEKLYAEARARLADIAAERARQEEEQQRIAAAEREAAKPVEPSAPAAEATPEATEPVVSVPEQEKQEPVVGVAEQEAPVEDKGAEQTAQQPAASTTASPVVTENSGTRTAIPSYIRGVIKHTPRPVSEPRPRSDRPAANGARPQPRTGATGTRPMGARPAGSLSRPSMAKFEPPATAGRKQRETASKKSAVKPDDKRQMNKRTLIRKGYIQENVDEERMGTRKLKNKKVNKVVPFAPIKIENAVITTENLTVKILSEKIGKTAQEIIKKLMELGIMTTINSVVDFPTMQLVADVLGVNIELKLEKTKEEQLLELHSEPDPEESLVKRPPIITVMGHVDHGKTSLLDAIRKTSVVSGEAGGITQHIGAYSVELNGEKITFLDTPGHEAFTEMRRRGATVTDIAVLIVAADDGVMPQTEEAIKHAKEANVPIVVAINKIDKQGANIDKIKQQLAEHELLAEEWGGNVPMIPISAKQNKGIDTLLENILFQAEYMNLRANPNRHARGYVIEARLDKGRGAVATVIVQNGTLKVGDYVVSGTTYGRVRSLTDDKGKNIKSAGPSTPVAVYGLAQVPQAGDPLAVVESEKMARQVIEERAAKAKNEMMSDVPLADLDKAFSKMEGDSLKEYKVLVKADVQGSAEALKESLSHLGNEEVKVTVVHSGVGAINQSDVMMAEVAKASIIGFNVKPDSDARNAAERNGISIKQFGIIYEALDYVTEQITDMLAPKFVERTTGKAIVRTTFKVSGVGIVAGSYVQTGKIVRGGKARLYRGGKLIHEGNIVGLKRFKDDAKEVTIGLECGIAISDYTEYLEDDEIECFVVEKESK
ncbi:MAG: translation initiation factor IF-2 [Clostridiales bacterium]|nr:translation initiation factor IF-2 [Clostridiales bacterium]